MEGTETPEPEREGASARAAAPKLEPKTRLKLLSVDASGRQNPGALSWEPPQFCEIYLRELNQAVTVNTGEEAHASSRVKRQRHF